MLSTTHKRLIGVSFVIFSFFYLTEGLAYEPGSIKDNPSAMVDANGDLFTMSLWGLSSSSGAHFKLQKFSGSGKELFKQEVLQYIHGL